jgi:DNA helicase-2/ATP-dependent DNA helicase PcrA
MPEWITKWFRDGMSVRALEAVAERLDDEKVSAKLEALAADVAVLAALVERGRTTRQLLQAVREQVGLGEAMAQLDRSKGEGSSQLDDLEALEQVADLHPDPTTFEGWLRERLARPADPGGVTLATVHKVKGREWPRVVVYGASSGLLPHRLAEDVEEERRVLHVGITRCRDRVLVLADAGRPSPFLDELVTPAPPGGPPVSGAAAAAGRVEGAHGIGRGKAPAGDFVARSAPDEGLFQALRAWRTEVARADAVPPYVVFADKVLRDIATRRPTTSRELGAVSGVGPAKLERHGDAVLGIVAAAADGATGSVSPHPSRAPTAAR